MSGVTLYTSLEEAPIELAVHFTYMRAILRANTERDVDKPMPPGLYLEPEMILWNDNDQTARFGYLHGPSYKYDREHNYVCERLPNHESLIYTARGTIAYAAKTPRSAILLCERSRLPVRGEPRLN